jgi:nicotinamide riboside transporter PnuC
MGTVYRTESREALNWLWILTGASLLGNVFNIRKSVVCYYIWTFTNIAWLIYDICNKNSARAALDAIQTVLGLWGIFEWSKKSKEMNDNGKGKSKGKP